jgi:hypothetical protein
MKLVDLLLKTRQWFRFGNCKERSVQALQSKVFILLLFQERLPNACSAQVYQLDIDLVLDTHSQFRQVVIDDWSRAHTAPSAPAMETPSLT